MKTIQIRIYDVERQGSKYLSEDLCQITEVNDVKQLPDVMKQLTKDLYKALSTLHKIFKG